MTETNEPSYDELKAELEKLKNEKDTRRKGDITFKVSEKSAVSVYGMGRFPVTLYQEQWLKLLAAGDQIREFIEANKSKLKAKEEKHITGR
jgi:hypothetical protein